MRQRSAVVYAAIFLAVWGAGLLAMAPACPHGDSGETAAVALHFGIAHPPGYPLPTMLGKLATAVFHVGTIAWRVSLLSLMASALSAVLAASLLRARMPAISGSLLFLLGTLVGLGLVPKAPYTRLRWPSWPGWPGVLGEVRGRPVGVLFFLAC